MEIRTRSPHTPFARRLIAAGAATLLAAAGLTVLAPPAAATEAGSPVSVGGVEPTHVPGGANRSCQSLADEFADGDPWTEVKFEDDKDEVVTGATKDDVTLTSVVGKVLDWTSEDAVVAVYVKSGSGGSNLYHYPTGSTGDEGLGTPSLLQAISHVSFCSGPLEVPPPPPVCEHGGEWPDCDIPVDCAETPEAAECDIPVDCAETPEAAECDIPVDCAETPEAAECEVPEVDCAETPDAEECEQEQQNPQPTCADDPDMDGCTQLGTPITIVNTDPVQNDPIEVTPAEVTPVEIERPATEVQAQITHRPEGVLASSTGAEVQAAPQARAQQLPRTGEEHKALVAAGLALILAGAALTVAKRQDHKIAA